MDNSLHILFTIGICLMGGASEDDNAMITVINDMHIGDILVLRASGSDIQ